MQTKRITAKPRPKVKREPKETNLRRLARDRECQIRIPGVCNGDSATTVLCHLPGGGMGRKHHDIFGAWGCAACHDAIDGRVKTDYPSPVLKLWHFEGMTRTQQTLIDEGVIRV